jgi:hypothetical protein
MRIWVVFVAASMAPAGARGAIATFDELSEGFHPTVFTSGGITFSNGLWFPGSVNLTFGIDNASGNWPGLGFGGQFSSPNVMNVGGWVSGPTAAFFRVHSWTARVPGQTFTTGSVDVFYIDDFPGTTVALQALIGGQVVNTDSFQIVNSNPGTALHRELRVDGVTFDTLRFICTGGPPGEENGILGVFDNVELVPAPATVLAPAFGLLVRRRRAAGGERRRSALDRPVC